MIKKSSFQPVSRRVLGHTPRAQDDAFGGSAQHVQQHLETQAPSCGDTTRDFLKASGANFIEALPGAYPPLCPLGGLSTPTLILRGISLSLKAQNPIFLNVGRPSRSFLPVESSGLLALTRPGKKWLIFRSKKLPQRKAETCPQKKTKSSSGDRFR